MPSLQENSLPQLINYDKIMAGDTGKRKIIRRIAPTGQAAPTPEASDGTPPTFKESALTLTHWFKELIQPNPDDTYLLLNPDPLATISVAQLAPEGALLIAVRDTTDIDESRALDIAATRCEIRTVYTDMGNLAENLSEPIPRNQTLHAFYMGSEADVNLTNAIARARVCMRSGGINHTFTIGSRSGQLLKQSVALTSQRIGSITVPRVKYRFATAEEAAQDLRLAPVANLATVTDLTIH